MLPLLFKDNDKKNVTSFYSNLVKIIEDFGKNLGIILPPDKISSQPLQTSYKNFINNISQPVETLEGAVFLTWLLNISKATQAYIIEIIKLIKLYLEKNDKSNLKTHETADNSLLKNEKEKPESNDKLDILFKNIEIYILKEILMPNIQPPLSYQLRKELMYMYELHKKNKIAALKAFTLLTNQLYKNSLNLKNNPALANKANHLAFNNIEKSNPLIINPDKNNFSSLINNVLSPTPSPHSITTKSQSFKPIKTRGSIR